MESTCGCLRRFRWARAHQAPARYTAEDAPEVALLIAAWNEQDFIIEKLDDTKALQYPASKLNRLRDYRWKYRRDDIIGASVRYGRAVPTARRAQGWPEWKAGSYRAHSAAGDSANRLIYRCQYLPQS